MIIDVLPAKFRLREDPYKKYSIENCLFHSTLNFFNCIFQTQLALAEQSALKQELKQRAATVESEDRLVSVPCVQFDL